MDMVSLKVLSRDFAGGTEEHHGKSQPGYSVLGLIFELGIFQMQGRNVTV
jgi:hypothetical protein